MASDPLRQYRGTTCYHLCSMQPENGCVAKAFTMAGKEVGRRKLVRGETSVIGLLWYSRLHRRHQEQESVRNLWPPQEHASVEVHLWQLQRGVWKSACICVA